MSIASTVQLPGGIWTEGEHHRQVELRCPTGADEAFVHDAHGAVPPAVLATDVLHRTVARLGPLDDVRREHVAALSVGDREALLLALHGLTLGPDVRCILDCPDPECGDQLELDTTVQALMVPPYPDAAPEHEVRIGTGPSRVSVRFRPPTGADQEALVPETRRDPSTAVEALVRRCVTSVEDTQGRDLPAERWPADMLPAVDAAMHERDPQAAITLAARCPTCGRDLETPFEAGPFLFSALATRARGLFHEVHTLALHYGWSEREVLALAPRRRTAYLDLVRDAIAGVPSR